MISSLRCFESMVITCATCLAVALSVHADPAPGDPSIPLIRRLCAENNLVGFDLVEFNPLVDPGYTTGLNANRAIQECLTGIAMRKKGIREKGYRSPLRVEDGRED